MWELLFPPCCSGEAEVTMGKQDDEARSKWIVREFLLRSIGLPEGPAVGRRCKVHLLVEIRTTHSLPEEFLLRQEWRLRQRKGTHITMNFDGKHGMTEECIGETLDVVSSCAADVPGSWLQSKHVLKGLLVKPQRRR